MADLLLDIGNTRCKYAQFAEGELSSVQSFSFDSLTFESSIKSIFSGLPHPSTVYISNVAGAGVAEQLETFCISQWQIRPKFAKSSSKFNGLDNAYIKVDQLGVDRWLAIIAVNNCYQKPFCVVDCGTAVTIDAVDLTGNHLGGLILPGLTVMRMAINAQTAAINIQQLIQKPPLFARSTEEAVSSGIVHSVAALIDNACKNLTNDIGQNVQCILAGGDASLIQQNVTVETRIEQDLVLKGLLVYFGMT